MSKIIRLCLIGVFAFIPYTSMNASLDVSNEVSILGSERRQERRAGRQERREERREGRQERRDERRNGSEEPMEESIEETQ
ncbi:MAG: hypothetical protein K940chlam7_01598 [Chlamydiae bacterium]|nr:hypothetical protein [Chlamydiota bacterium]